MNIKSPADLETAIGNGQNPVSEFVDALGETLERIDVKSHAEAAAADMLDAATTKDGRPKPIVVAIGALVLAVVALVIRRLRG